MKKITLILILVLESSISMLISAYPWQPNWSLPKISSTNYTTQTFYQCAILSNGVCSPCANQELYVTFNDDGSITTDNRRWTYKNQVSPFVGAGWVNGLDFITISNDGSVLSASRQTYISGIAIITTTIFYTSSPSSQERILSFCMILNNNRQSTPNYGGGSTIQPNGTRTCSKCHGQGRVEYNTYPPQY